MLTNWAGIPRSRCIARHGDNKPIEGLGDWQVDLWLLFLLVCSQTFVVRKSSSLQRKVISLRLDSDSGPPIKDFLIKESQYSEYQGNVFVDVLFWQKSKM